ncbi:MAG TPA: sigma-70 family RNA polymerase sigma factor [Actinomycetota bacterium]|nr:sigma-70 family RNA polymerase sigma factor [Actinomycetota bacterium]
MPAHHRVRAPAESPDDFRRLAYSAQLESLIESSLEEVRRLCIALVDRPSADDLVQETFLRAITALRTFRGDAPPRTWLLAIARYVCMDELRTRVRRREQDRRLLAAHRCQAATDVAEESSIRELLGHLDADRRAAFVLTQVIGLTYPEASAICRCPTGTIRSRVARARQDLMELMAGGQPGRPRGTPVRQLVGTLAQPGPTT